MASADPARCSSRRFLTRRFARAVDHGAALDSLSGTLVLSGRRVGPDDENQVRAETQRRALRPPGSQAVLFSARKTTLRHRHHPARAEPASITLAGSQIT